MNIIGGDGLTYKGTVTASRYRNIRSSCQFQQRQRIARGQINVYIAADGGDGLKLDVG